MAEKCNARNTTARKTKLDKTCPPKKLAVEDPPELPTELSAQTPMSRMSGSTHVFVGGLPESESRRLETLLCRAFTQADAPNEPWREHYGAYLFREDGAVVAQGVSVELGWVDKGAGRVHWVSV